LLALNLNLLNNDTHETLDNPVEEVKRMLIARIKKEKGSRGN
jgi:hypothetical protein